MPLASPSTAVTFAPSIAVGRFGATRLSASLPSTMRDAQLFGQIASRFGARALRSHIRAPHPPAVTLALPGGSLGEFVAAFLVAAFASAVRSTKQITTHDKLLTRHLDLDDPRSPRHRLLSLRRSRLPDRHLHCWRTDHSRDLLDASHHRLFADDEFAPPASSVSHAEVSRPHRRLGAAPRDVCSASSAPAVSDAFAIPLGELITALLFASIPSTVREAELRPSLGRLVASLMLTSFSSTVFDAEALRTDHESVTTFHLAAFPAAMTLAVASCECQLGTTRMTAGFPSHC